jgi:L-lactate dehydrogenase complex protein LldG
MSREKILQDVRAALPLPEAASLPDIGDFGITFEDKVAAFAEMLRIVGGTSRMVSGLEEIGAILHTEYADRPKWASFCSGIESRSFDPQASLQGHDYHDVDLVVLEGSFGVAENAAIWVPGGQVAHPASLVLSQHLAIVVRASQMVDNMHQAYRRIGFAGALPRYGVFISGPSKTADIEQSLVIGAHGARSLVVFILP